ncbi:MAG: hypothetical protein K2O58_11075, partial [Bacteroidales bacterium]|nr:hypothetical protein [Bacteroidales bacterium]
MKKIAFILVLAAFSTPLFLSCTDTKSVNEALHDAEMNMADSPKLALDILESIEQSELKTRKLQARHALMLSMALDKNYVDVANDSIIAPSVK